MKLAEILEAARSEPADRRTPFAQHALLIRGLSPALMDIDVGTYRQLADGYRPDLAAEVSAVVLTRNEELTVGSCVAALTDDCDRVLLVDAESDDSTVDRARASFPRVTPVSRPWTDDFAAQRNAAFGHADGAGWLAHVDADETLLPGSAGRLRAVLALLDHLLPDTDLVVSPHIVDTSGASHTNTRRVLRTTTGLRFKGRLHERPYDPEGNMPLNVEVDVTFRHTGYEPEVVARKQKEVNYARLMRLCLEEEPDNPKWHFYAVRDSMVTEDPGPELARAHFRRLQHSLGLYERPGRRDYETERHTDALVLLCDLALRFGGGQEIGGITAQLKERGHPVEAAYYASFAEFSVLLNRASGLMDRLAEVCRAEVAENRDLLGRSYDLQALLALSCGRYDELPVLLAAAHRHNGGKLTERSLGELRAQLPAVGL